MTTTPADRLTELFGDVIHAYSRAQAIEDGELIDVTDLAREAGFLYPLAITRAAWLDCCEWDAHTEKRKPGFTGQSTTGRLWDVLNMARFAAKRGPGGDRLAFTLYRLPTDGRGLLPRRTTLKLHIGPGDTPAPVFTISLPNED